MAGNGGNAPIIIKRVQGGGEAGHHGGAWKVAYADFVTAMMAFFLLMWLLNATTEKQRQGLAEYFNPTLIQTTSSGSDGPFGGEVQDAETNSGKGAGASTDQMAAQARDGRESGFDAMARHIQNQLTGSGAESMQKTNLLRHVVTRMTDEGLVIELTDLMDAPLFEGDSAQPTPAMKELAGDIRSFGSKKTGSRDNSEVILVEPNFPRFLYIQCAHMGWHQMAKKNGLRAKDIEGIITKRIQDEDN